MQKVDGSVVETIKNWYVQSKQEVNGNNKISMLNWHKTMM